MKRETLNGPVVVHNDGVTITLANEHGGRIQAEVEVLTIGDREYLAIRVDGDAVTGNTPFGNQMRLSEDELHIFETAIYERLQVDQIDSIRAGEQKWLAKRAAAFN